MTTIQEERGCKDPSELSIATRVYGDLTMRRRSSAIPSIDKEEMRRAGAAHTECAHPRPTYFDVFAPECMSNMACQWLPQIVFPEGLFPAPVLAVSKRFGYGVENLNGFKVHSLFDVMTMRHDVHDWFDRLDIWFEASVRRCTVSLLTGHLDS
ncbi:hypothetical protein F5148DRAFT_542180 [Russula earlei]|uniref:Uncharacterized protein n=1 Tax=Russula earlei TaxID=71964 RepID=A0ACC0UGG0_9AGAM|nr:hypothetical protein F5148DRAFT_542180 [Russula earlei]